MGSSGDCSGKEFSLQTTSVNFGDLKLSPKTNDASASLFGTLRLRDGHLPRGFYPVLGINAYATVELATASGAAYSGFVNNFGDYVIPQVPVKESFTVQFGIDGEVLKRDIDAKTGLTSRRAYELSAILANSTPRLHALTAMANGKQVQIAAPGSKVTLHAVADDPDGDPLEYRWVLPDTPGFVAPTANSELVWTLPNLKKRFPITVVVSDKRGGYTQSGIFVDASSQRATFSGTVVSPTGKPIEQAQIDVNGRLINTNSTGWFSFNVPIADRYVMNIRKPGLESTNVPGFGAASFIYRASVAAGRWTLRRAQVSTVDPTQPILLQQKRGKIDCPGPVTSKIDWKPYLQPGVFDWQDTRGNSRALADLGKSDEKACRT